MTPDVNAYLLTTSRPRQMSSSFEAPAMCSFPQSEEKRKANRCLSEYLILFNKRLMNACRAERKNSCRVFLTLIQHIQPGGVMESSENVTS